MLRRLPKNRSAGLISGGQIIPLSQNPSYQDQTYSSRKLKFFRHLMTGEDAIIIPDNDCRPVSIIRTSNTTNITVGSPATGNWSSGSVLIYPRRRGGQVYTGQILATGGTGGLPSPLPTVNITVPFFLPLQDISFVPDPISSFKYVRPSSLVVGLSSRTTGTTTVALSGTINAVVAGDLNDLTTANISTYPTIAVTSKDFIQSGPIYDGCVFVAGPEIIQPFRQPFENTQVIENEPSLNFNTFLTLPATVTGPTNYSLFDFFIGGRNLAPNTFVITGQSGLPNDLIDTPFEINIAGTLTGAAGTQATIYVAAAWGWTSANSLTAAGLTTNSYALDIPLTNTTYLLSLNTGPLTYYTCINSLNQFTGSNATLLRLTVYMNVNSGNTVQISNLNVNAKFFNYYDESNSQVGIISWTNVADSQQIVLEANRIIQGVTTGTLSQYMAQTSSKSYSDLASPAEIPVLIHMFNDPRVSWVKRIWTYQEFFKLVKTMDYSIETQINMLQAAGSFENLAILLAPLLSGIPYLGKFAKPGLSMLGRLADNALASTGFHPGTNYKFSTVRKYVPPGQSDMTALTAGSYDKPMGLVRWAKFPGVTPDGVVLSTICNSAAPVCSLSDDGSCIPTIYLEMSIVCADDNTRTYWVSENLCSEDNALMQSVELLGTLIPEFGYLTDCNPRTVSGASFGLAGAVAIIGLPNHRVCTGVVICDGVDLLVKGVEYVNEKVSAIIGNTQYSMIIPTANVSDELPLEAMTPVEVLTGQPMGKLFSATTVQDVYLSSEVPCAPKLRAKSSRKFHSSASKIRGLLAAGDDIPTIGEVLSRPYEIIPLVDTRLDSPTVVLAAIYETNNDNSVNALDNCHKFRGARIVIVRFDEGVPIVVDTSPSIKGRSWEYAYLTLMGNDPTTFKRPYALSGLAVMNANGNFTAIQSSFIEFKRKVLKEKFDMDLYTPTSSPTFEASWINSLPKGGYYAADKSVLENRWISDFESLASMDPNYLKLMTIFEFLEEGDLVDAMSSYATRHSQLVNGNIQVVASPLYQFIEKSFESHKVERLFEKSAQAREARVALGALGITPTGNIGVDSARAAKAQKIAQNARSAGIPVTADWVVRNGFRGPSELQAKFYRATGTILDDPAAMNKTSPLVGTSAPISDKIANKTLKIAQSVFNGKPTNEQIALVQDYLNNNDGKGPDEHTVKTWLGKIEQKKGPKLKTTVIEKAPTSRFRRAYGAGDEDVRETLV